MTKAKIIIVTSALIIVMLLCLLILSPSSTGGVGVPPYPAPLLTGDPNEWYEIPLPSKIQTQKHINSILSAHGMKTIKEDGVCGPETNRAWDKADALQDGYFITREAVLEKERTEK